MYVRVNQNLSGAIRLLILPHLDYLNSVNSNYPFFQNNFVTLYCGYGEIEQGLDALRVTIYVPVIRYTYPFMSIIFLYYSQCVET